MTPTFSVFFLYKWYVNVQTTLEKLRFKKKQLIMRTNQCKYKQSNINGLLISTLFIMVMLQTTMFGYNSAVRVLSGIRSDSHTIVLCLGTLPLCVCFFKWLDSNSFLYKWYVNVQTTLGKPNFKKNKLLMKTNQWKYKQSNINSLLISNIWSQLYHRQHLLVTIVFCLC